MNIFSIIAKFRNTKGFTLIELSMVLIIIGIILGLGLGVLGPTLKGAKVKQAEGYIDSAIESVVSFGMTTKRLPSTGAEFTSLIRNPNDPWGNSLYYIYDNDTATAGSGGICGRRTTSVTLQINDVIKGNRTITDVAFIIFSSGANFNIQTGTPTGWGTQDVRAASPQTVTIYSPLENPNTTVNGSAGSADPYDDIVKWVTLSELRTQIGCQGAPLQMINNEMPSGSATATPYSANVFASGGVPYAAGGYQWYWDNISGNMSWLRVMCGANPVTRQTWSGSGSPCTQLSFDNNSGTPAAGSYNIRIAVSDNNNNNDNKSFVITINP
ncbi:MAG: prepilin-type N-terminal cleavage/methylation domain-containing protein [Nitrospirae bacterium]|nr:prepilin-type N-terminal cleavage/methylation domain-containing protein [Nitrospirota bacterium]